MITKNCQLFLRPSRLLSTRPGPSSRKTARPSFHSSTLQRWSRCWRQRVPSSTTSVPKCCSPMNNTWRTLRFGQKITPRSWITSRRKTVMSMNNNRKWVGLSFSISWPRYSRESTLANSRIMQSTGWSTSSSRRYYFHGYKRLICKNQELNYNLNLTNCYRPWTTASC